MKPQSARRRKAPATPKRTAVPARLSQARRKIDTLDDRIVELLGDRAEIAAEIAAIKRAGGVALFHDPEREHAVVARLAERAGKRFPTDAVRAVFREIMSACLSVEEPLRVAYLGPEGTFTQMAAHRLFGLLARYGECATVEGVFEAVASGDAVYGVVPFENSTEGSVSSTSDALLETDLRIRQELVLPIAQCLLSRARSLTDVKTVYSHPQALAQCRSWLAKHMPRAQVVQTTSTAAAAREAHADDRAAAIAGALAGEVYDLPVLRANVQDRPENATRFVVIAKQDAPPSDNDRTTIVFGLADRKGALRRVLTIFESAGVNLTRIESRPSRRRAWHYAFLIDVEGHRSDPRLRRALEELSGSTDFVRVVGSYARGDQPRGR